MTFNGHLQSDWGHYWVALNTHIEKVPSTETEWIDRGNKLLAALAKNPNVTEVASLTSGNWNSVRPEVQLSAIVSASGLWGAMTTAAQVFFLAFDSAYGHSPLWTEAKIKRLEN